MSIQKILIANRGEIAIRITKSAKKLGIKTVAIKTVNEPDALYLQFADEVFDDTENVNGSSVFLSIERLIVIAQKTCCDALHPGYGFLSENAELAKSCQDNRINFIGPSAESIQKLGNKLISKAIAEKNGIPMVAGSKGVVSSPQEAKDIAMEIGYPVIIKASSGGGGKGMRVARSNDDIEKMFRLAGNEALKSFNDSTVFVEKYVENPKHIEFQILGDKQGNVVHLGERECSIQRKHQKLFEESPSAAIDDDLREKMGKVAVKMAKAAGYFSAGTVEFLLDDNKQFYFMEMNTRIQVEHPVTEMVTGIDLIEQQIRIANGESLTFSQVDVKISGWAFECRVNAEDVQLNFSPNAGQITQFYIPNYPFVRIDTGIVEGSIITGNFDSMIAKLIIKGTDRKDVIAKSSQVLEQSTIRGIKTTLPFFRMLMDNKDFIDGNFNTSFIEKELDKYYALSGMEKYLSAWLVTQIFVNENFKEQDKEVIPDYGSKMDAWLINKRLSLF